MSNITERSLREQQPIGTACAAWSFVAHPAAFFAARLQQKPNWLLAFAAPVLCALLQLASALLISAKTLPIVRGFLVSQNLHPIGMRPFGVFASIAVSMSYLITYGMTVVAVVCLDVLLKDSGRLKRLAEFTGLSFFSHVPYCALMVIAAFLWSPDSISLPAGASVNEMRAAIQEWREAMFAWPLLAAARVINYYVLIWHAGLLAVCMKVVSRFSVRATLFAGGMLLALFIFIQIIGSHH